MLFTIENKRFMSTEQLRTNTLLNAYFVIQKYPLRASDTLMDQYIKQQYNMSLKDLCVKLLLDLTFFNNDEGSLVLLFKNPRSDALAQFITYGNGAIPGSRILQTALAG
jgi:hypothetical protein